MLTVTAPTNEPPGMLALRVTTTSPVSCTVLTTVFATTGAWTNWTEVESVRTAVPTI
jgi:hypothetical protein